MISLLNGKIKNSVIKKVEANGFDLFYFGSNEIQRKKTICLVDSLFDNITTVLLIPEQFI